MRYFVNKETGVPYKDWISPLYTMYWQEVDQTTYRKVYASYYGYIDEDEEKYSVIPFHKLH